MNDTEALKALVELARKLPKLPFAERDGVQNADFAMAAVKALPALERLLASQGKPEAEAALKEMEARKDAAYLERNQVVAALAKCFPSGVAKTAIEGWSEDWHGCVYIDLPTGQASWHYHDSHAHLFAGLPLYTKPWDGHTTDEKYQRLAALQHQPIKAGASHAERATPSHEDKELK